MTTEKLTPYKKDYEYLKKVMTLADPHEIYRRFRALGSDVAYLLDQVRVVGELVAELRREIELMKGQQDDHES